MLCQPEYNYMHLFHHRVKIKSLGLRKEPDSPPAEHRWWPQDISYNQIPFLLTILISLLTMHVKSVWNVYKKKITRAKAQMYSVSSRVVETTSLLEASFPQTSLLAPSLRQKYQSQALDEKTARTYELHLISLEKFAKVNGDDAQLFGPNKRPFLAATIQTYLHK